MSKIYFFFLLLTLFLMGCTSTTDNKEAIADDEALIASIKDAVLSDVLNDMDNNFDDYLSLFTTKLTETVNYGQLCSVGLLNSTTHDQEVYGSAVIYHNNNDDYLVLTNGHNVRSYSELSIYLPTEDVYVVATLEKTSEEEDLAILSFSYDMPLNICEITPSPYRVGEFVIAIGSPLNLDYTQSATIGIISNTNNTRIQHDAAINVGSSGGGLFNIHGDLIGLNVSKINTTLVGGSQIPVVGIGFAISQEAILNFINE